MVNPHRHARIVETLNRRQPDLGVLMENVHKTRNLGAVVRTCDAVGIGTVHAVAPADESLNLGHKTAGGTKKWVEVVRHADVAGAYDALRLRGWRILAADIGGDTHDFRAVDYVAPVMIVIGSELDGLSPQASAAADVRVHVPIMGMVDSLNVSVALGVILYEAARQREAAGWYAKRRIPDDEYERLRFEWLHPSVAAFCRERGLAYPRLDADGEIIDRITQNRRDGYRGLA